MEYNGTLWNVKSSKLKKKNYQKHILETELKQAKQLGSFSEKIKKRLQWHKQHIED